MVMMGGERIRLRFALNRPSAFDAPSPLQAPSPRTPGLHPGIYKECDDFDVPIIGV